MQKGGKTSYTTKALSIAVIAIAVLLIAVSIYLNSVGWLSIFMVWTGVAFLQPLLYLIACGRFAFKHNKTRSNYLLFGTTLISLLIFALCYVDFRDSSESYGLLANIIPSSNNYLLAFSLQMLALSIISSIFLLIDCHQSKNPARQKAKAPYQWLSIDIVVSLALSEFIIGITLQPLQYLYTLVYPLILVTLLVAGFSFAKLKYKSGVDYWLFAILCLGSYLGYLARTVVSSPSGSLSGALISMTGWPVPLVQGIGIMAFLVMSISAGYLIVQRYQKKALTFLNIDILDKV